MKSIIFSLFLIFSSLSFVFSQQVEVYTEVGQQAPAFTITDLDGNEFKLTEFRGKVVFVFFWTTWCPYCRTELPHLENEIWQKYKSEDFVMLGIAREQTNKELFSYRKASKNSFPIAADPKGEVFKLFGDRGVPRSYVIDRKGKILYPSIGLDPDEFSNRKNIIEKELNRIKKEKTE